MKYKIFIGMREIAGYYTNLSKGFRAKGHDVTLFDSVPHPFQYERDAETLPPLLKAYSYFAGLRSQRPKKFMMRQIVYLIASYVSKGLFFLYSLFRYDAYIFSFGTSFFPKNFDLLILKIFRKKVICNIAHGSEARPIYINGAYRHPDPQSSLSTQRIIQDSSRMKHKIKFIERHASLVIAAPLSSQFIKGKVINSFFLGIPFSKKTTVCFKNRKTDIVRILHSPSHPVAKGTHLIRQAITALRNRGYAIDYVEVIGQPHDVVLKELERCDFVVDQVYSDTPMAGFATEAAFYGKPAVVGGYGWAMLKNILPPHIFPPSQICHPDTIEEAIEQLIANPDYCLELSKRAHEFVTAHWRAELVAENYIRLLEGNILDEWWLDPNTVVYVNGMGLSERDAQNLVAEVVRYGGASALQLDDKPQLKQKFLEFANIIFG
ncbi:hypothetical protein U27_00562 [Candidatus Vecturithrix granuli]|uniref:Glycosyl transferase family 1 domain-containing protein n=1 Tax=Vecturithrix granuli TaxID=1499967 RepID=A0A081C7W0_VECG1|nr:hypothetical protein U27_00562 [Candidatus Vecturithrix granuli]